MLDEPAYPRHMSTRLLALVAALVCTACSTPAAPSRSAATARPATTAPPSSTPPAESEATEPAQSGEPLGWSELSIGAPAAREDHTWTVTGDGRLAYLFGGRDGATVFDDLWAYDLDRDTWTEIDAAPGPAGRFGHEAAWVEDVGLVVFAGQSGSRFFGDMWAFSPSARTWRLLPAAGDAPVARYGSCAAVGPDGRLWISHGFTTDGSRFADTRAYDFEAEAWTDETPEGARPIERCLHGCWWTDDGGLALYAGQTTGVTALGDRWLLADGGWSEVTGALPPERNLYARARLDGATLVFGGQGIDGAYLDDMWLLSDGADDAIAVEPVGPVPPGRAGAEMVRDAIHGRVLLFGGRDGDGVRADTWELRGGLVADAA
jgi:hypothetical protein